MKSKREYTFDVLRLIAMIMVIVIHVSNIYSRLYGFISEGAYLVSLIFNTIARISVPIFFMISGSLLVDRKFNKTKYFKRLLRFLIIIIVWDVVYLIWEYCYLGIKYNNLLRLFIEPYRAHLWFLYSIFILYFIQPLIKLILDKTNNFFKIMLLIIWITACSISMYNAGFAEMVTFVSNIGFFVLGKYVYEYVKKQDLKKHIIILIALMILGFSASIYLNFKASIKFDMFYNLFFAYRTPFIVISSLSFFVIIYNIFSSKKINKVVIALSDLSLGVYLVHGIFLDITNALFDYINIHPIIGIPLFTFLIFTTSTLTVYLLKKIKFINNII